MASAHAPGTTACTMLNLFDACDADTLLNKLLASGTDVDVVFKVNQKELFGAKITADNGVSVLSHLCPASSEGFARLNSCADEALELHLKQLEEQQLQLQKQLEDAQKKRAEVSEKLQLFKERLVERPRSTIHDPGPGAAAHAALATSEQPPSTAKTPSSKLRPKSLNKPFERKDKELGAGAHDGPPPTKKARSKPPPAGAPAPASADKCFVYREQTVYVNTLLHKLVVCNGNWKSACRALRIDFGSDANKTLRRMCVAAVGETDMKAVEKEIATKLAA